MARANQQTTKVTRARVITSRISIAFRLFIIGIPIAGAAFAARQVLWGAGIAAFTLVGCAVTLFRPMRWNPRARVIEWPTGPNSRDEQQVRP